MNNHVAFALAAAVSLGLALQTAHAGDPAVTPEPQPAKKAAAPNMGSGIKAAGLTEWSSTGDSSLAAGDTRSSEIMGFFRLGG